MAKLNNYTASMELPSGAKCINGRDFPLMEAHAIQVREDGTRLDTVLDELENAGVDETAVTAIVQNHTKDFVDEHTVKNMLQDQSTKFVLNSTFQAEIMQFYSSVQEGGVIAGYAAEAEYAAEAGSAKRLNPEYQTFHPVNGKITPKWAGNFAVIAARGEGSDATFETMVVANGYSSKSANGYYCRISFAGGNIVVTFYNPSGQVYSPEDVYVRCI